MSPPENTNVMIVGAGLAGSLLASMLGRRGYTVNVYERRADPRAEGFIGGRSINLALSTRGLHALEKVGLADEILKSAIPMRGRIMHDQSGDLAFQPYSKNENEAINSVSRGGLNVALLNAADAHDNVTFHFEQRCMNVDLDAPSATFQSEDGSTMTATADVIIGTDGAFSAVRGAMQVTERFNYSQQYLDHGYKELHIPPTADGEFALEPNALHIWPRGGFMMIALPNEDRSFTCTTFMPYDGPVSYRRLQTEDEVRAMFNEQFPDAVPLMPTLVEDHQNNPTGSLVTIRCWPWHHGSKVLLLGDSSHAIVPFYGQGMNAAFEDCAVLDDLLEEHGPNWEHVLWMFSQRRKVNADAIADMAVENFYEMRDKVGDPAFLRKKKFEKFLHRLLPGWYTPLYNMVTFSRIPYAEARQKAEQQSRTISAGIAFVLVVAAALLMTIVLLFVL